MIPGRNIPDGTLAPYERTVKTYQTLAKINISLSMKV
jgi:hypothetical protein